MPATPAARRTRARLTGAGAAADRSARGEGPGQNAGADRSARGEGPPGYQAENKRSQPAVFLTQKLTPGASPIPSGFLESRTLSEAGRQKAPWLSVIPHSA